MYPPTDTDISEQRVNIFKERITEALSNDKIEEHRQLLEQYAEDNDVPPIEIAAALSTMAQGKTPLFEETQPDDSRGRGRDDFSPSKGSGAPRPSFGSGDRRPPERQRPIAPPAVFDVPPGADLVRYRIEVGRDHGAGVGNIVGAIANEAGLDSKHIGRIDMRDDHSLVDLPSGMPRPLLSHLKKVWVSGQQLRMTLAENGPREHVETPPFGDGPEAPRAHKPGPRSKHGLAARKPKHRKNIGKPKRTKLSRTPARESNF